jgi:hypothetical protein
MLGEKMSEHRIRLRGPWLLEPTSSPETPARAVRLPIRWGELVESGATRVRLSRRFHSPTNLGPEDQVSVVVNELPQGALVCLNGASLGPHAGRAAEDSVFPTPRLQPNNLLTVEFDVGTRSAASDGAWGEVALLISSS